jgi:hypothetical protein
MTTDTAHEAGAVLFSIAETLFRRQPSAMQTPACAAVMAARALGAQPPQGLFGLWGAVLRRLSESASGAPDIYGATASLYMFDRMLSGDDRVMSCAGRSRAMAAALDACALATMGTDGTVPPPDTSFESRGGLMRLTISTARKILDDSGGQAVETPILRDSCRAVIARGRLAAVPETLTVDFARLAVAGQGDAITHLSLLEHDMPQRAAEAVLGAARLAVLNGSQGAYTLAHEAHRHIVSRPGDVRAATCAVRCLIPGFHGGSNAKAVICAAIRSAAIAPSGSAVTMLLFEVSRWVPDMDDRVQEEITTLAFRELLVMRAADRHGPVPCRFMRAATLSCIVRPCPGDTAVLRDELCRADVTTFPPAVTAMVRSIRPAGWKTCDASSEELTAATALIDRVERRVIGSPRIDQDTVQIVRDAAWWARTRLRYVVLRSSRHKSL